MAKTFQGGAIPPVAGVLSARKNFVCLNLPKRSQSVMTRSHQGDPALFSLEQNFDNGLSA
jgi:hypothetical protein